MIHIYNKILFSDFEAKIHFILLFYFLNYFKLNYALLYTARRLSTPTIEDNLS